jgi:hypothetical protein
MKKFSKFPKIGQFRQTVKEAKLRNSYIGKDDDGEPIFDKTKATPVINFKGTVKLHGTNAGVGHTPEDGIWAQSRNNIITVDNDNAGFAKFVHSNEETFIELMNEIRVENSKIGVKDAVYIFGEWVGKSIQKGVVISQLEKSFFIFDVKVVPEDESEPYHLDSHYLKSKDNKIFNIEDFETYEMEIDFEEPESAQNKLGELTMQVEEKCPVAKEFGFEGVGEGIVWSGKLGNQNLLFKVKGEKHSVSKVKTLAKVDTEKLNSINEFVDYAVTENRFNQALGVVFPDGNIDIKKLGDTIKWVVSDVLAEESDVLKDNNLEPKDIGKYVAAKVKKMFFAEYSEF